MDETIEALEAERKALYRKFEALGDFRRGTISVNYRKCGKKNCVCAKAGHPGHGPQYLWNTTIKGKSYARGLHFGPELEKYRAETERYREFLKLCEEAVELNERICDLRPVPPIEDQKEMEELKKKLLRWLGRRLRRKSTD